MKPLCLILPLLTASLAAPAQIFLSTDVQQVVPDADATGLASTVEVSGLTGSLGVLRVSLVLDGAGEDGGFNGDLYAYLRHGTGFAVLLNRPGRQADSLSGYGDSGMSVVFEESAVADIHDYRVAISGDAGVSLDGPLTGTWKPDGRGVDPEATVSYDGVARTATLDSFVGLDPNGEWTLHLFDLAAGGQVEFRSWSVAMAPVPEPWAGPAVIAGMLGAWGVWRRRARGEGGSDTGARTCIPASQRQERSVVGAPVVGCQDGEC